jgi:Mrp family chromosome partitioning ATPase
MLESKGELIEEIPLFKLNVNSQEWWTHLADRFHEFYSKSAYRAFAFYSEIQNSGVTTILINIANVLTDKKKRVLVITTDIPNGYDIKHKVNPAVSILFIKQFEQQQIETAGISYDNFDYVFIDCKPYQNPIEVLQFGIKYDSVVLVVRTGISNVQKTIKQIETFVDRDMQCNIILNGTFKIHMANHIPYKNKDIHQLGSYRRSYKQLKRSQS